LRWEGTQEIRNGEEDVGKAGEVGLEDFSAGSCENVWEFPAGMPVPRQIGVAQTFLSV
jgi:hypothetical protein